MRTIFTRMFINIFVVLVRNAPLVEALLREERVDVNRPALGGVTPMQAACWEGHLDVVRLLLTCVPPAPVCSTGFAFQGFQCQSVQRFNYHAWHEPFILKNMH